MNNTKRQLIEAAIKLFAQNDVSNFSVQQINDLAGVNNKSALYYHFKSKWGLIEASFNFILEPYVKDCMNELEKIDRESIVEVRSIVYAMLKPMVNILMMENGIYYIKFFSRMISAGDEGRKIFAESFSDIAQKSTESLSIALPHAHKDAVDMKVLFTFNVIINVVSDVGLEKYWNTNITDRRIISKYLMDYIEGGMRYNIDMNYQ